MPIPILLIVFIIFLSYFQFKTKKVRKNIIKERQAYWDRETQANFTRRKSLENLSYITLDLDALPFNVLSTDQEVLAIHNELQALKTKPMVNLRSYDNTELKLAYGAANLETLSTYENNYNQCLKLLYQWGVILNKKQAKDAAITVLEYGLSLQTDLSEHYILLGQLYNEQGRKNDLQELIKHAETLKGLLKNKIISTLKALN